MLDFHIFIHGHRLWIRGNGGTLQICVKYGKNKSKKLSNFKFQNPNQQKNAVFLYKLP